jgi:hypothetical protein
VDQTAYDAAAKFWQSALDDALATIERLKADLVAEHANSASLRREVARLNRIVLVLRKALDEAGIPVPPEDRDAFTN